MVHQGKESRILGCINELLGYLLFAMLKIWTELAKAFEAEAQRSRAADFTVERN